jgi:hypothetical protein
MTIAVGFRCIDGVVLAADSLYTEGVAKLYGQKSFLVPSNGRYALTIAGSGGVPSLKGIVREIKKRLKGYAGPAGFAELQDVVESALCAFYPKHIDSAPKGRRGELQVQLLFAIWVSGYGTRLFETFRTDTFEVDDHRCIGVGSYLASYLNDVFFPPGDTPSVRSAQPLAAYIVGRAKHYVQYCGGHTFVRALLNDGTDERVWNEEISDSEEYFAEFFKTLGTLRGLLNRFVDATEIDIAPWAKILKDGLVEFKQKQKRYRDLQAKRRATPSRPTQPE